MCMELLFILVLAMDIFVMFYQYLCSSVIWNCWIFQVLAGPSLGIPISVWFSLSCSSVWLSGTLSFEGPDRPSSLWPQRELKHKGQNEGTDTRLHQEHPSPFPSLSRLSHCPDPLTTPSSSSDTAPGSSLANTDQGFSTYWIKKC